MARIVKNPDVRRSEILDVAQRLFYQKGYKQTSVQNVINEIGIITLTAQGDWNAATGSMLSLAKAKEWRERVVVVFAHRVVKLRDGRLVDDGSKNNGSENGV